MGSSGSTDIKKLIKHDDILNIRLVNKREIGEHLSGVVLHCLLNRSVKCMEYIVNEFHVKNVKFVDIKLGLSKNRPKCIGLLLDKIPRLNREQIRTLGDMDYEYFNTFKIIIDKIMMDFIALNETINVIADVTNNEKATLAYAFLNTIDNLIIDSMFFKNNRMIKYLIDTHLFDITKIKDKLIKLNVRMNKHAFDEIYKNQIILDNCIFVFYNYGHYVLRRFCNCDNIGPMVEEYITTQYVYEIFLDIISVYKNDCLFDINVFIYEVHSYIYHVKKID